MEEAEQHINFLELKAAVLALKAFLRVGMQPPLQSLGHHPQHHILLEIDNTTAVGYVNRSGDSVTIYVPTDLGTVVLPADPRFMDDRPSLNGSVECGSKRSFEVIQHAHRVDTSEGCLRDIALHFYVLEVDLFASRFSHRLPLYVSRLPDPGATAVDAFKQDQ